MALLLSFALATACTTRSSRRDSDSPRTLAVAFTATIPNVPSELSMQLTTERLVQTTAQGEYEPRLADSWSVTNHEDGRQTVTVVLREGVTFHDGTALTADIVKLFLDNARTDARHLQENPALGDIERIDVVGANILDITQSRASVLLFDALSIRIQYESDGRSVGTGPFRVEEETDGSIRLIANQEYYLGPPSVDEVSLTSYPTLRAAWTAMMRDEVDFLFEVPVSAREFFEAASRVDIYTTRRPYAFTMAFNMRKAKLADPRLRRALNYAVDRRAIIQHALGGDGRPASGVWSAHWAYGGVERTYRYDPILADEMLTEAGLMPPSTDVRNDSAGIPGRFHFTCIVPADTAPFEQIALIVQRQLREVGVEMQLEAFDTRDLGPRLARGDWDAVLVPQNTGRTLSRLYNMWHSSEPFAMSGYTAADRVLDSLRSAADRPSLAEAAAEFQQLLYDDPPAIFLAEGRQARAVDASFRIPAVAPGQEIIDTLWQWQRAGE